MCVCTVCPSSPTNVVVLEVEEGESPGGDEVDQTGYAGGRETVVAQVKRGEGRVCAQATHQLLGFGIVHATLTNPSGVDRKIGRGTVTSYNKYPGQMLHQYTCWFVTVHK